jgi:hypothetical protein
MIFCLPGGTGKQKAFRPHQGRLVANGLRLMENRYLPPARQKPLRRGEGPILHKNILLCVLSVSNESRIFSGRVGGGNRSQFKLPTALGDKRS